MKKTVLITGASSGFGHQTAKLFQKEGWNVVATMRSPEKEQELNQLPNVLVTRLDVEDQESITEALEKANQQFGSIDVLVNNAGYGIIGIFESFTHEDWQKQYAINVFGMADVTRSTLPYMRKQGSGAIINVASFGGQVGMPIGSLYNSSKFAVEGISESLYYELDPLNIFVKIIEPGSVRSTNFSKSMAMVKNEISAYDELLSTFPLRLGAATANLAKATAEDIASTIYEAATDGQSRLRYSVGADGQFFIEKKHQLSEQEFTAFMHNIFTR